jgi:glutathione synthase/RimK-type ligase-like ATP-grasp enzyme
VPGPRIALATDAAHATLTRDDRLLLPALHALGAEGVACIWDDHAVEWRAFDGVVLRSCWDYHLRLPEFERWLDALESAAVPVRNTPPLVRWNARKRYLVELAARGHAVVPTRIIEPGDGIALDALLEREGWTDAVLKPVVSASAHDTWRVRRGERQGALRFRAMCERGAVLVQPFLPEIMHDGEWSLVYFAGGFSHAARKRPRAGDFRVQSEHGGSASPESPPDEARAAATRLLADVAPDCVYARVDGCMTASGWHLMELELVEPSLFLGLDEDAPARFARALVASLEAGVPPG